MWARCSRRTSDGRPIDWAFVSRRPHRTAPQRTKSLPSWPVRGSSIAPGLPSGRRPGRSWRRTMSIRLLFVMMPRLGISTWASTCWTRGWTRATLTLSWRTMLLRGAPGLPIGWKTRASRPMICSVTITVALAPIGARSWTISPARCA